MKNKNVLITGGTGSLGHALAKKYTDYGANITIYSRDEKKQYDMKKLFPNCRYMLGDIKDYHSIRDAVRGQDIIIHGASLKYVNISELQPAKYVNTNVVGTLNLVNAVLDEKTVERCVGISTDKACMPVNTYGLTKALLEKIMLEANTRQANSGSTIFNVARYGNVIGTRGSVIPFWQERREAGLSIPITNPNMTRFFFTIDEAVDLIEYCLKSEAGVIISKAMKGVTLDKLADIMKGNSEIEIVGERPGEKHDEMLLSPDEIMKSHEENGMLVFNPNISPQLNTKYPNGYSSKAAEEITKEELKTILKDYL